MSKASEVFTQSILDAENLLSHFNTISGGFPRRDAEVLKRAGLIMAMTAWETYVEDRIFEFSKARLSNLNSSSIAAFVETKLEEEVKRLHNPTSDKTIQLFQDYAEIDLTNKWVWNPLSAQEVKKRLNEYIKLRGEVVHRSRPIENGPQKPDPVNKEDLVKVIKFLRKLVEVTEVALNNKVAKN